jgi:hypothetical protein
MHAMIAIYDKLDVRFHYPENWEVSDEQADEWPRAVTIQSPGTAFWSLHIYSLPASPVDLAAEAMRALKQEYEGVHVETLQCDVAGHEALGYEMDFHYLDLIVRARVLGIQQADRVFLILTQAEDGEFEGLERVFLAMTTSLLTSPAE